MNKNIILFKKIRSNKVLNIKDSFKLLKIFNKCNEKTVDEFIKTLEKENFKVKIQNNFLNLEGDVELPKLQIFKNYQLITIINL